MVVPEASLTADSDEPNPLDDLSRATKEDSNQMKEDLKAKKDDIKVFRIY